MKQFRRSTRLKGYDYSLAGAYFITLVTDHRACLFGDIVNGQIILSELGKLAQLYWARLPTTFPNIQLGEFIIMPNHLHAIIWLLENGIPVHINPSSCRVNDVILQKGTGRGSLGAVIQNYKSVSTRANNRMMKTPGKKLWQLNYFERVIRNERGLNAVTDYILANPMNWQQDSEYPG